MCVGLVMEIISIDSREALCRYLGNGRKIRVDLLENLNIGDYILVHAGFGISKLNKEDALERLRYLEELERELDKL